RRSSNPSPLVSSKVYGMPLGGVIFTIEILPFCRYSSMVSPLSCFLIVTVGAFDGSSADRIFSVNGAEAGAGLSASVLAGAASCASAAVKANRVRRERESARMVVISGAEGQHTLHGSRSDPSARPFQHD